MQSVILFGETLLTDMRSSLRLKPSENFLMDSFGADICKDLVSGTNERLHVSSLVFKVTRHVKASRKD